MELVALLDAVDDLALEAFLGGGEGCDRLVKLLIEALSFGSDGTDPLATEIINELRVDQVHAFLECFEVGRLVEVLKCDVEVIDDGE